MPQSASILKLKKSFTLIELLIVIGIMGILAATVLVAVNPLQRTAQARDSQRKQDLSIIKNALEQYAIDHGTYPNTGGYCCSFWVYSDSPQPWIPGLDQTYFKRVPIDPLNSGARPWTDGGYHYAYSSDGAHFNILAQLEYKNDSDTCAVKQWRWVTNASGASSTWCAPDNPGNSNYIYAKNDLGT